MSNPDQSLGDTTPETGKPSSTMTPFGDPTGTTQHDQPGAVQAPPPEAAVRQWTLSEILDTARLPEKRARVCLRADLQAEYDQLIAELAGLIDAQGLVINDEERPAGVQSNAARATALADRLEDVRREMADAMWYPLFRGLSSDALREFNNQYRPKSKHKDDRPDMTDYNTRLIAECAVEPALTVDDVRRLRKTLGTAAVGELAATVNEVCSQGGTDFPQLPAGLARLREQ